MPTEANERIRVGYGQDFQIIDSYKRLIESYLRTTGKLSVAKAACIASGFDDERLLEIALQELARRGGYFANLIPGPLTEDHPEWYLGPPEDSIYWPDYVANLKSQNRNERMIEDLDKSSSKLVSLLKYPENPEFSTRGLVVGKVQSGKTAHFTGVITKAADVGYGIFIVLAGMTNNLRKQTQERLEKDLCNPEHGGRWYWLTSSGMLGDFEVQPSANASVAFKRQAHRTIAVVKKQTNILQNLTTWLQNASTVDRNECPVMIIDDESDQASINTARQMDRDDLSRINSRIVDLLSIFRKCTYIGYTATPFANVLIDPNYPENLYPRSFIFPLIPPKTYFGATRIHGRERLDSDEPDELTDGLNMVRLVADEEMSELRPSGRNLAGFNFHVTASLANSIRYFIMASACRLYRQRTYNIPMDFSTMLIHTSQRIAVHTQSANKISEFLLLLSSEIASGYQDTWKVLWDSESASIDREKVSSELKEVPYSNISPILSEVLKKCKILVSNSTNNRPETVVTFEEKGQIAIVIGGNTLSRGLTLEGLVVSFFVRTANAYDTIMQMGRWFGYRENYEDLQRIWLSDQMRSHFRDLSRVEQEFHEELDHMRARSLSPLQAAVRIRRHPSIMITAPNKMRFAITAQIRYLGTRPQTIYFKRNDFDWLEKNISATFNLINQMRTPRRDKENYIWTDVSSNMIIKFLDDYSFHERSRELDATLIKKYIKQMREHDILSNWHVVLKSRSKNIDSLGTIDFGNKIVVNCINRSRLESLDDIAEIKSLMDPYDIIADKPDLLEKAKGKKAYELFAIRGNDRSGVLVLYPVSKDSVPQKVNDTRVNMNAVRHIMGVAFIFPEIEIPGDGDYVSANLNPEPDSLSYDNEEDFD